MNYQKLLLRARDLFRISGDITLSEGALEKSEGNLFFKGAEYSWDSTFDEHNSGVIRRSDSVTNISDRPLSLTCAKARFVFDGGEYEVFTQYTEWCAESIGQWQPLITEISAGNDDLRLNAGSAPFVAIYNKQTSRGVAFHILAESTWSINVRKNYFQTASERSVSVELGIRDHDFLYTLAPGETLKLPDILFYEFRNNLDLEAWRLHRYCNDTMRKPKLPIIYNSWMCNFDHISFELLENQLILAKEIGAEYFVVDAGWFGKPNFWGTSVGDWVECTEYGLKGRMKEFAELVRTNGLKFGLWFETERAGKDARLVAEHPEFYVRQGNDYFVDYSKPEVCDFFFDLLASKIEHYGIDFIKFDFNSELNYDRSHRSFIDYYRGYWAWIKRLRDTFPSLYLENCASGGMRMALPALQGMDSCWMSDNHSLYWQLEIFKRTILRMPPNILEHWITICSIEHFTPRYGGGESEKIVQSCDGIWDRIEAVHPDYLKAVILGGPIGISCDLTRLNENTRNLIRDTVAEYRGEREFWAKAEARILCDTDSMLVLQFSDRSFDTVKVLVFARDVHQTAITVYPICDTSAKYQLNNSEFSGEALDKDGFSVHVRDSRTASVLTFKRI